MKGLVEKRNLFSKKKRHKPVTSGHKWPTLCVREAVVLRNRLILEKHRHEKPVGGLALVLQACFIRRCHLFFVEKSLYRISTSQT